MPFSLLPHPFTLYFYSCFKSWWENELITMSTQIWTERSTVRNEGFFLQSSVGWVCQCETKRRSDWERGSERCELYAGNKDLSRIFPQFTALFVVSWPFWRKETQWSLKKEKNWVHPFPKTVITFRTFSCYAHSAPPGGNVVQEVIFSICLFFIKYLCKH